MPYAPKYLLLVEAFEVLKAVRVFFKVDTENLISQKAMVRIGAKLKGVFRNEWILPDGRVRHSCIYSIIDTEWPATKNYIKGLIQRSLIPLGNTAMRDRSEN